MPIAAGSALAIIVGENEWAEQNCQVKLLATGDSTTASLAGGAAELVTELRRLLG